MRAQEARSFWAKIKRISSGCYAGYKCSRGFGEGQTGLGAKVSPPKQTRTTGSLSCYFAASLSSDGAVGGVGDITGVGMGLQRIREVKGIHCPNLP